MSEALQQDKRLSIDLDQTGIGKKRVCPVCSRSFTKTEHLERHVRSHTKERPFRCEECGKSYGRQDTLLRHQRYHSKDAAPTSDSQEEANRAFPRNQIETSPVAFSINIGHNAQSASSAVGLEGASLSEVGSVPSQVSFELMDFTPETSAGSSVHPAPSNVQFTPNFDTTGSATYSTAHTSYDGSDGVMQTLSGLEPWNSYFNSIQFPSWLIDETFDFDMLGTPIAATMAELAPNPFMGSSETPRRASRPVPNIEHMWLTNIKDDHTTMVVSGTVTPVGNPHQMDVDEDYRKTLHKRLQVRATEQVLPSPDFLNQCVRMYFAHFNSVFPVVHAPTFRPTLQNSMLLLSICSVGSLFTGSSNAAEQGTLIFEKLNKAILATWDRLISRDASEVIPMIQAALIGQTFGLLSGHPKHLAIVETFHGTVIAWARRTKVFEAHQSPVLENLSEEGVDKSWKEWARREELIRIGLGLHVHDAELTGIFHHEPFLRHSSKRLPISASSEMFKASSAQEWATLCQKFNFPETPSVNENLSSPSTNDLERIPFSSRFTIYAALEGITAEILENRKLGLLEATLVEKTQFVLMTFYRRYLRNQLPYDAPDSLGIKVLWHVSFMSLFADFDLLERAVGRDGPVVTETDFNSITVWASSIQAKRCVIHASLIHKNLETIPIGFEPAIHVPRAMFLAAISWYCYTQYGPTLTSEESSRREFSDFPEIGLLNVNPALLLFEANGFRHGKPASVKASGTLCGLTDLLQRIGHWEIARRFASLLGVLIHSETD